MWEALAIKLVVSVLVPILQKSGFINSAEKLLIKFGAKVVEDVGDLKTYSSPTDFVNPPPQEKTPNNLSQ